jgi:hypothetical protein
MDEEQWLHEQRDAEEMVKTLLRLGKEARKKIAKRKLRLYVCGSCRLVWHLLDDRLRHAVEVAERLADGRATKEEVAAVHADIWHLGSGYYTPDAPGVLERTAAAMVVAATERWPIRGAYDVTMFPVPLAGHSVGQKDREALLCDLLRCVVGNPFRPLPPRPEAIAPLAKEIYAGAWDRMALLGEWLQEHGFWQEGEHCLDPSPKHVKGCWVVDWVTGRE